MISEAGAQSTQRSRDATLTVVATRYSRGYALIPASPAFRRLRRRTCGLSLIGVPSLEESLRFHANVLVTRRPERFAACRFIPSKTPAGTFTRPGQYGVLLVSILQSVIASLRASAVIAFCAEPVLATRRLYFANAIAS